MTTHLQIEPAYADALRAVGLDSFDALMAVQGGDPTSVHDHRETLPIDFLVNGTPQHFYLKRVFRVPLKHTLAPLLRGQQKRAQPVIEWDMLGELTDAGIPAMQRVAVGERRIAGRTVAACLLVCAVPAKRTFDDWINPAMLRNGELTPRLRLRLLAAVGSLVGQMIRLGFIWPDFQSKHLFAETCANGIDWSLWLIDVERMERNALPSSRSDAEFADEIGRMLGRLRRSCPMTRFSWRDYLHVASTARRAAGIAQPVAHHAKPHQKYRDWPQKFHLSGLYDATESMLPVVPDDHHAANDVKPYDGFSLDTEFRELFCTNHLDSFDRIFNFSTETDLRKPGLSAHRSRGRFSLTDNAGRTRTFYIKRYSHPPTADQLRRIFTGSPVESSASREFRYIRKLNQIGLSTLRCVAVGQRMVGLAERQSFLITEGLDDISLERYAANVVRGDAPLPSPARRREITRQLACVVLRLHGTHYFHRDLYLAHVFLHHNADRAIALRLIDLARMLFKPRNTKRWVIKDLAALDYSSPHPLVTRADRIRFLRYYLGPRPDLRYHIRQVAARVRKMAEHDVRHGRRNTLA